MIAACEEGGSPTGSDSAFACVIVVLAVTLAVVAAAADPAPEQFETAPAAPREQVAVPYGPRPEQVLDVRLPAVGRNPMPVLVYAHGGGWVGGTRRKCPT